MGIMDDAKRLAEKGRDLAAAHEGQVDAALDRVSEEADRRTGGKHAAHIERGRDAVDGYLDGPDGSRGTREQGPAEHT